ncbi:MAG: type II/IV secretion system protein [Actinobacteria bacterium]|nr:type II/IV secretion system protein [Actinomycetota bacterium]
MQYTRDRLGELLLRAGVITEDQLLDALAQQQISGGKLGQILVQNLAVDEDVIARTLAEQKGLEFISLAMFPIDREAASMIPARVAERSLVIPVGFRDGSLVLAMADPLDVEAIDDVHLRTNKTVVPVVATATQIQYAIEKFITSADAFEGIVPADEADEAEAPAVAVGDEDVPIVRLVNQLIREAVLDQASDIHIEPGAHGVRVRFRVDGVLHEVMTAPSSARAGLISRVKVMAEMDIAERRRPQDGRIGLVVNERPVDMRVAALPTPFGENIVIRLLNHEASQQTLGDLGMSAEHLEMVEKFLSRSYGEILISGPTGSGKSTSLYAALMHLNSPTRKIITIEDPIEYQIAGITQMAVHASIGLTFASLLRTVLRSDPDVVMVGEIRDVETAQIATRAALTGHLVLSSIHTNDAPSALTRLTDMEVAPFVASSALIGVVAQRLVRKLCSSCKELKRLNRVMLTDRGFAFDELRVKSVYEKRDGGCDKCHGTGFRGRTGVFEIMPMDSELERLFLASAPSEAIRSAALAAGMKTLRADGLDKVAAGVTSLDEVARVVL